MGARTSQEREGSASVSEVAECWVRVVVKPGGELHLRKDLPKLKADELKEFVAALETALRKGLR